MASVTFIFEGIQLKIQCLKEDRMISICNRYISKINMNINSLYFLYGGNQINFDLTFKEQANSFDQERNEMNILVYKKEEGFKCPQCGELINLDIFDDLIKNNLKDLLIGLKSQIDNIINFNDIIIIKSQIKITKIILDNIINENKKNMSKIKNLISDYNIKKENIRKGAIHNENQIKIKECTDAHLNNEKINKNIIYSNNVNFDTYNSKNTSTSFKNETNNNVNIKSKYNNENSNNKIQINNINQNNIGDPKIRKSQLEISTSSNNSNNDKRKPSQKTQLEKNILYYKGLSPSFITFTKSEISQNISEEEKDNLTENRKELYNAIEELKPENINDNIKAKLLTLANIHLEYQQVENDRYGQEYDILQDKYDKKYLQIYDKIEEIVKSKEKIKISPKEAKKYGIKEEGENHEIEDYWHKVIINSRYFTMTDKDKVIMKYIKKVNYHKFPENANNFRVDFIFHQNEFFIPEVLSKTYEYDNCGSLKKTIGTQIHWKGKDKNPTIERVKKKIKKGKKVFYELKEEKVDSFFCLFSQIDNMKDLSVEVMFFKEDLFVNQLEYYLDIASKIRNSDYKDLNNQKDNLNRKKDVKGSDNSGKKEEECRQQ